MAIEDGPNDIDRAFERMQAEQLADDAEEPDPDRRIEAIGRLGTLVSQLSDEQVAIMYGLLCLLNDTDDEVKNSAQSVVDEACKTWAIGSDSYDRISRLGWKRSGLDES